jgi:hypothetical protein
MYRQLYYLIGADEGGVGKTTVARTLLDHFATTEFRARASTPKYPEVRFRRHDHDPQKVLA